MVTTGKYNQISKTTGRLQFDGIGSSAGAQRTASVAARNGNTQLLGSRTFSQDQSQQRSLGGI